MLKYSDIYSLHATVVLIKQNGNKTYAAAFYEQRSDNQQTVGGHNRYGHPGTAAAAAVVDEQSGTLQTHQQLSH